jgi:Tol biopolymer transport system component
MISPDGQHILYLAGKRGGEGGLWIRSLHGLDASLLVRGRVHAPFWSPDSRAVAFLADGQLNRMDLESRIVETVCALPGVSPSGSGTWGSQGIMIFPVSGGLVTVPEAGGVPVPLSSPDRAKGQEAHRQPWFLPDGRHYLFQTAPDREIWVASLDGSVRKRVARADSSAVYAPPGWLLFVRQNTLLAQRFDLSRLETRGEPQPLAYDVRSNEGNGRAVFTVSSTGVLVYRTGDQSLAQTLTWLDRAGTTLGITKDEPAKYWGFALLPDGQSIVARIADASQGGGDLWRIDLERGSRTRLTSDPRADGPVVLSPDGRSIAWRSDRVEPPQIFRKPSTGAGTDEHWIRLDRSLSPSQWSRNYLVFDALDRDRNHDLWFMPTTGPGEPRPFLQTPYNEGAGQLSPDEQWMAYESNEGGQAGIFIRPFPPTDSGGKWPVSDAAGGFAPRWRSDGRELLYFRTSRDVMSVAITPGVTPGIGVPRPLFHVPVLYNISMAMTPDATRFLYAAPEVDASTPLTVVVNWTSLLAGK